MVWRYPWERLLISSLELWPLGREQHWHRQEHASVERFDVAAPVAVVVADVSVVDAAAFQFLTDQSARQTIELRVLI